MRPSSAERGDHVLDESHLAVPLRREVLDALEGVAARLELVVAPVL